jgi:PAS domain S-box-containing protein
MPTQQSNPYLGPSSIVNDKTVFNLTAHLKENLADICDLILEIMNAHQCDIAVEHEGQLVSLFQCRESLESEYEEAYSAIKSSQFKDIESYNSSTNGIGKTKKDKTAQVHILPLTLRKTLLFGVVIFAREDSAPISPKETRILKVIARDIQNFFIQQKEAFEAEKSNELQKLMLQMNQDLIFVKDREFKILYGNDAFMSIYPKEMQDKIIGYTTVEEYNAEEADKFLLYDRIAFEEGHSETTEDLHLPDGSHVILSTSKRRFEDKDGSSYILCICRDITEKEILIRGLKKANQELDDFTSIASHDLKAPLNAIRRLLTWILEESADVLPENAKENLHLVVNRAERMHSLLNDLLKFAKIGREEAKTAQISLAKSVEEMRPLIDVSATDVLESEELLMNVAVVPFNTILLNLISNAFKHNDKDIAKVHVSASVSKHYYIVKITDNGPGIAPQFHERIFKLFQTLKPRDEVEGSGMGLSVVKKYIEYYQGRVELSSDGKNGSTFILYWPVAKLQEQ